MRALFPVVALMLAACSTSEPDAATAAAVAEKTGADRAVAPKPTAAEHAARSRTDAEHAAAGTMTAAEHAAARAALPRGTAGAGDTKSLTVFLTGSNWGEVEPCG